MLIIGITGSLGTGKTTVAKIFGRLGAAVLNADEIAHRVIEPGKPGWKKVKSCFGKDILNKDKTINRRALADRVFADNRRLDKLCRIIHPLVYRAIEKDLKKIKKHRPGAVVVLDVPLLLETCGKKKIDKLIVVTATRDTQIKRARKKFGLTRIQAMRRINAQMPLSDKIKAADYLINNNGSLVSTKKQAMRIWQKLTRI